MEKAPFLETVLRARMVSFTVTNFFSSLTQMRRFFRLRINASPVEWEVEEREGVGAIVSASLDGGAEVFSLAGGGDG